MKSVDLARDTSLARSMALNIPSPAGTEGAQAIRWFVCDARALATLDHSNPCPVIGPTMGATVRQPARRL